VGLQLAQLEPLPKALKTPTWVILVGQPTVHVLQVTPAIHTVAQWLRNVVREHLRGRRYTESPGHHLLRHVAARARACSTNRQCTTHHDLLGLLHALAPHAGRGQPGFVIDGPVAFKRRHHGRHRPGVAPDCR
jgi:hypothetical protein